MTRSDARGRALACVVLFAFVVTLLARAAPVRAADGDEARARALFGEGRKLADAGHYAQACVKFEDSLALDPGVGTSFNLADCHEHLGRTASAWARFLEVAAATNLVGQLERERVARARAAALEAKLARLTIEVTAPVDGLVVTRDGAPIADTAWGTAVPVDPGPHVVEARAPGHVPWSRSAEVPGQPGTIVVSVPALEALPLPPRPPLADTGAQTTAPTLLARAETPVDPAVRRRWLSVVGLGALGLAGAAAGAVLAFESSAANAEALKLCIGPDNSCEDADEKARHAGFVADARRDQILAIASASVGVAAFVGAAYLWWRPAHPPAAPRVSSLRLGPSAHAPLGAALSFTW